jgi:murein L,D-transpeptidase YafK
MGTRRLAIRLGVGVLLALSTTTLLVAMASAAQNAQLHIYWGKSTWVGWQCSKGTVKVILDDKQIAQIREKDCVKVGVALGDHVLQGVKQALVKRKDLIFEVDSGKNIFVRGTCNSDGKFEWNLQTTDQAKEWASACQPAQ